MKLNKMSKNLMITAATILTVNTVYAKNNENHAEDDSFFFYNGSETQFKTDVNSLSYTDILSLLQKTSAEKQVTSLDTIFSNRVVESKEQLPNSKEGTEQNKDTGKDESKDSKDSQNSGAEKADYNSMKQDKGNPQLILGGKTADDLMNESSFPCTGGHHLKISGKTYDQIKATFGTAENFDERGNYDPPVPHYSQAPGAEAWNGFKIGGDVDLREEGCYMYMHAHIFTVLTGKAVNPPEMAVWLAHYGCIETNGMRSMNKQSNLSALYDNIGYNIKIYNKSEINDDVMNQVKEALQQGIPQGIRTADYPDPGHETHFLCIDRYEKDSDSFVYAQACSKATDTKLFPAKDLLSHWHDKGECLYLITKK